MLDYEQTISHPQVSHEGTRRAFMLRIVGALKFSVAIVSGLIVACQPLTSAPQVERSVLPPMASPTVVVCTSDLEDVQLRVHHLPRANVSIEISGLQPGEKPHLIFIPDEPEAGTYEVLPERAAESDGTYRTVESLRPSPQNRTRSWELKVVHARGVACTQITVPGS